MEYNVNQKIKHHTFGDGIVIEIKKDSKIPSLIVVFDDYGIKNLAISSLVKNIKIDNNDYFHLDVDHNENIIIPSKTIIKKPNNIIIEKQTSKLRTESITLRLEQDLKSKLEILAKQNNRSLSDFIRLKLLDLIKT